MPSVRPADKPRLAQPRQDPAEHVVASAHADALSGVRDRGVHGRLLRRGDAQPGAQAQRVLDAPGNRTLGAQALEVAHHRRAEVKPRRQGGPAALLGVELAALVLDEAVEVMSLKEGFQVLIERLAVPLRQGVGQRGSGVHVSHGHGWILLKNPPPYPLERRPRPVGVLDTDS